jgi:carboxypeptidase Q
VAVQRRRLLAAAGLPWLGFNAGAWMSTPARAATLGFSPADLAHAERLRDAALNDAQALGLVRSLTQDIGARPAGSSADAKAVAWAQARCQALGLQNVRAEPFDLRVWRRGPASAQVLAPERFDLVLAALGNSVGTPEGGLEGEIAFYDSYAALKADTSDRAKGRIVFVDQRTTRSRDGAGYSAAAPARFGSAVEAARRGAIAVVIRSIGTDAQRIAHTGSMRYDDAAARIPAVAVSVPDADRIAALQAQGPVRLQLQVANQIAVPASSANVIAEVPGTDLADEVVLLGAHLDSWDLGEGAVDNAAGVGIVCAAAALIRTSGQAPRRTIRLVLFGNEENGFDGALAYGKRYGAQRHQLVSESDFGAGAVYALRSRVASASLPAFEAMAGVLAPLGVPMAGNNGTPGPDGAVLMRRHRWPGVELSQDGTAYFDVHHTVHDTFARMDTRALPQNVACWAVVAWLAAQSPWPFEPLA